MAEFFGLKIQTKNTAARGAAKFGSFNEPKKSELKKSKLRSTRDNFSEKMSDFESRYIQTDSTKNESGSL
jgi:hypothetical protein